MLSVLVLGTEGATPVQNFIKGLDPPGTSNAQRGMPSFPL